MIIIINDKLEIVKVIEIGKNCQLKNSRLLVNQHL
jgi:hypothetical protein